MKSPIGMRAKPYQLALYLQKVLLIHFKKSVFYMIYKSKMSLRVSFKH